MKDTKEIEVLKAFIVEFSPYHSTEIEQFTYDELVDIVKETAEKL